MKNGHDNVATISPTNRSAVSNGRRLFLDGEADQRSPAARRFRDLVLGITSDLGGRSECSEGEAQLVRRAAALGVAAEVMEGDMAQAGGRLVDVEAFCALVNAQQRVLNRLGLRRRAKPVPSLHEYLEHRAAEAAADA